MIRKADTLMDWNRDLMAFNCMDRIPEIRVGKYFFVDIKFRRINGDVVAFYSTRLDEKVEKLEKENEQLKARVKKMKNCWNCKYYNVGETTCLKGKPHNSGGCFKDWELAE